MEGGEGAEPQRWSRCAVRYSHLNAFAGVSWRRASGLYVVVGECVFRQEAVCVFGEGGVFHEGWWVTLYTVSVPTV